MSAHGQTPAALGFPKFQKALLVVAMAAGGSLLMQLEFGTAAWQPERVPSASQELSPRINMNASAARRTMALETCRITGHMEQTPKPDYWDDLICIRAGCSSGKQQTGQELISRARHKPKTDSRIFKFECFFSIFVKFLLNFTTVQLQRAISSLSFILHCKELQLKILLLQCWQSRDI